MVLPD